MSVCARACTCMIICKRIIRNVPKWSKSRSFSSRSRLRSFLGLMKSDSYPRFLKSALYKTQLVEEMEGRKFPCQLQRSATLMPDMMNLNSARKSDVGPLKSANDLSLSKDQKNRQSLLPWNRTKKPKKMAGRSNTEEISSFFGVESSTDSNASTASAHPVMTSHRPAFAGGGGGAKKSAEKKAKVTQKKSAPDDAAAKPKPDASSRLSIVHKLSALTLPLHKMRGSRFGSRESLAAATKVEEAAAAAAAAAAKKAPPPAVSCKIRIDYLPPIEYKGDPVTTIKETLATLLRAQGILHSSFDCYHLNSDRPLNVDLPTADLNEKEIVVESRVLFRLDFPSLVKSLGIKARPNKPFLDILKPLLKRYDFSTTDVEGVKLVCEKDGSQLWAKDLQSAVAADFDSDRITVLKTQPDLDFPFVDSEESTPPPPTSLRPANDDAQDLSDATMSSGKGEDDEDEESLPDGLTQSSSSLLSSTPARAAEKLRSRRRHTDDDDDDDSSPPLTTDGDNLLDSSAGSHRSPRRKQVLSCSQIKQQSEEPSIEPLSPSLRRAAKVTSV